LKAEPDLSNSENQIMELSDLVREAQ